MNDLIFIPKYIRTESDLNYGEAVTHENYNEKVNLNIEQGNHNTRTLEVLLNSRPGEPYYRIAYLDEAFEQFKTEMRDADVDFSDRIDAVEQNYGTFTTNVNARITDLNTKYTNWSNANAAKFTALESSVAKIIDGTTKTKRAEIADKIQGIDEAGPRKYYGTNKDDVKGFHYLPPVVTAVDAGVDVVADGVFYLPAPNTVSELMLTQLLRDKINRETISDYDVLTSRPSINGVLLTGNVSLDTLNVQPKGDYLTSIPADYVKRTELDPYYKTTVAQTWVNDKLASYATNASLNSNVATLNNNINARTTNTTFNNYKSYVEARHPIIQIGSWNNNIRYARVGDLLVSV